MIHGDGGLGAVRVRAKHTTSDSVTDTFFFFALMTVQSVILFWLGFFCQGSGIWWGVVEVLGMKQRKSGIKPKSCELSRHCGLSMISWATTAFCRFAAEVRLTARNEPVLSSYANVFSQALGENREVVKRNKKSVCSACRRERPKSLDKELTFSQHTADVQKEDTS